MHIIASIISIYILNILAINNNMIDLIHQQNIGDEQQELKLTTHQYLNNNTNANHNNNITPHKTKLIIFYDGIFHLSIGPDYIGFILGFSMLVTGGLAVLFFVHNMIQSQTHFFVGQCIFCISVTFYLLTALRNPGLYNPHTCLQNKTTFCHQCLHLKPKRVIHCLKCDACIEGYDHHCPWISKCVGKSNVVCFYIFATSISCLSMYMYYSFYLGLWAGSKKK